MELPHPNPPPSAEEGTLIYSEQLPLMVFEFTQEFSQRLYMEIALLVG